MSHNLVALKGPITPKITAVKHSIKEVKLFTEDPTVRLFKWEPLMYLRNMDLFD